MIDPAVVRAVVDKAPPLTPAQRDRLRAITRTSTPRPAKVGAAA
ncbi:hypothetical protein [Rhodococcus sp. ARC_M5]|nr:hypothetical protein [Rhodococcus sp. ARC_M5]